LERFTCRGFSARGAFLSAGKKGWIRSRASASGASRWRSGSAVLHGEKPQPMSMKSILDLCTDDVAHEALLCALEGQHLLVAIDDTRW
jgi:hypothetical protein